MAASGSNSHFLPCRPACLAGRLTRNRLRSRQSFLAERGKTYLVSAEGGAPQPLLPGEREEGDPNWSPDGTSLVFWSSPSSHLAASVTPTINILDLRTHKVSVVPGSEGLFSPHWSPDGRYIAAMTSKSQA